MAQRLKRLPGMRKTWVQSLGQEDPLEKEMATHSSTLACRIPWREEPGRLQSMGPQRVNTTERLHFNFHLTAGKSRPDRCSCLEPIHDFKHVSLLVLSPETRDKRPLLLVCGSLIAVD